MKDNEIKVAIAEACGWVRRIYGGWGEPNEPDDSFGVEDKVWDYVSELPNYCNDLNAMHEAEKFLPENEWAPYRDELRTVVLGPVRTVHEWCKADLHPTARQRAEAFLRTIGKWKEEA